MKSRIVILLSVTLAALLLVVGVVPKAMPTSPALAVDGTQYMYSVPFVCGYTYDEVDGVKPANYATTVNIHNPDTYLNANVSWKLLKLYPWPVKVTGWKGLSIGSDLGRVFTCKHICNNLGLPFPPPFYITGFVVIVSDLPPDVYAVYTVQNYAETDIDVEHISPTEIYVVE